MASSECQFDVFVSFRGQDTRGSFTSHLLRSLKDRGIDYFSDAKLQLGSNLSVLFKRIEQSKISIVVFSEHYADSTWCLDEIWKIIQCSQNGNHKVIPIFLYVKTSDVGEQKGRFGAPFLTPEESFKEDFHKVEAWEEALEAASNIVGFVLPGDRTESDVIEEIIMSIMNMLAPCETSGFPGIETRSKELEELLKFDDTNCVRSIGVLGMTGIGKTTVADIVFKQNYSRFDGYCILEDIGNDLKRYTIRDLRDKLFCELLNLKNEEVRAHVQLQGFVKNKKVFIVLDNVTEVKQITDLLGDQPYNESYRKGSRIVIITRDKKLLQRNIDATYLVPELNDNEAMELFCLKAFSDEQLSPPVDFYDLSMKFVDYSKGHPLALRLLGSVLRGADKSYWTDRWNMLMKTPNKELQRELKTSYEALDDGQKIIFLDIACFFKSKRIDFVLSILKADHVVHDVAGVIRDLKDKCLLTISGERLEMHDLMHIVGKQIECESSIKIVGRRSRLWNHNDIRPILEKNKGTKHVRGIFLNMSNVVKIIKLSPAAFRKMSNLKFLKFHNYEQWCESDYKFQSCQGVDEFPDELVYLHWQGYPYDYLPSRFDPEKLVDLNMRYSNIIQLWGDEMITENLRWVDLSHSKALMSVSGLSNAINLERLNLEGCTSLATLGLSLKPMKKLIYLNLKDCTSLESLPPGINVKTFKTLIIIGCLNLQEFDIISENIQSLSEGSALEQVVEHIELHVEVLSQLSLQAEISPRCDSLRLFRVGESSTFQ